MRDYQYHIFSPYRVCPLGAHVDHQHGLVTGFAIDKGVDLWFTPSEDGLPVPPYKVYNIGNNQPENLLDFVTILQEELVRAGVLPEDYDFEAHKELVPMQPGDVPVTYADTTPLEQDFGFKPSTSLRKGLRKFAEWYYEGLKN